MSDHPSRDVLGRYGEGDLPPDELLAIDAHLAHCADCRAHALAGPEAHQPLRAALASSDAAHLGYETLEAYADGALGGDARDAVESHLSACETCSQDVGDLRRVRAELSLESASSTVIAEHRWSWRWLSWRGAFGGFAALGAAAVIAWFVTPGSDTDSGIHDSVPTEVATAPPGLELQDGALVLVIDANGNLSGLPAGVPEVMRQRAQAALASGRLAQSSSLDDLRGPAGALMGDASTSGEIGPLSPAATVVESDRPTFRWTARRGASSYRVTVFDSRFDEVADSGELTSAEWTPVRPLPRGVLLTWQIAATIGQEVLRAPVPPAPEARFRVADRGTLARIEEVRAAAPGSHLLLAMAYNEAGMLEAAAAELDALREQNPEAPIVAALGSSLRRARP
jgi:predicted anti-sigma-YlaC factor YlaD